MKINIGKDYTLAFLYNNELVELYQSKEWSYWMRILQNLSLGTIYSYMKSMERFWIWSLYNNVKDNEAFPFYQARYRENLKTGFTINEEVLINNQGVSIEIYSSKSMTTETIDKEMAGIKSYFFFVEDLHLMQDSSSINKAYENRKAQYSFLSSVNMKKSQINHELTASKREFVKPYKKRIRSSQMLKSFPTDLFDNLLELSNPRERLIYLLCGTCSARIGQALNLTIYDVDYENQEIWLIDPKSDDKDIYGNRRVKWLKEEYNIDVRFDKPHNALDLQFKYPIPYEYEPLHWINPKYKTIFFSTLIEYINTKYYLAEASRVPRHPFLFVTKSGNRLRTREVNKTFKSSLKKLNKIEVSKDGFAHYSLHSLRHMFGFMAAELYGYTGNDALIMWTKNAMGHSSLESTMVYFNMSFKMKKELLKKAIANSQKRI